MDASKTETVFEETHDRSYVRVVRVKGTDVWYRMNGRDGGWRLATFGQMTEDGRWDPQALPCNVAVERDRFGDRPWEMKVRGSSWRTDTPAEEDLLTAVLEIAFSIAAAWRDDLAHDR